jgi:hypothetical protein
LRLTDQNLKANVSQIAARLPPRERDEQYSLLHTRARGRHSRYFALCGFGLATGAGMPEIEHEYANCTDSLDFLWHHNIISILTHLLSSCCPLRKTMRYRAARPYVK